MLRNGYTLPCPNDVQNNVGDWSPKDFYETISVDCFNLDPSNRASFATLVVYIESHLTHTEIFEYGNNMNTGN